MSKKEVVIDLGSWTCKVGFAGDSDPMFEFRNVFGGSRGFVASREYIGEEAVRRGGLISLMYPVQSGMVQNWDLIKKILNHVFQKELELSPQEHPVMLMYFLLGDNDHYLEKMAQVMFDYLKVPALCLANPAPLFLRENELTTGVVLESGHGITKVVAVYNGEMANAVQVRQAGNDVSTYLSMLRRQTYSEIFAMDIFTQLKENSSYVALDYEAEIYAYTSKSKKENYTFPNGHDLPLGKERFQAPELLFKPHLYGLDSPGIHQAVHTVISQFPAEARKDMYANILLSGGNTMFPGLPERLEKEVEALADPGTEVKVIAHPDRKNSAWRAVSRIASTNWATKEDYDKIGSSVLEKFKL